MTAAISQLLETPEKMAELSTGAIARAQEFILSKRIAALYHHAAGFIKETYMLSDSWTARSFVPKIGGQFAA